MKPVENRWNPKFPKSQRPGIWIIEDLHPHWDYTETMIASSQLVGPFQKELSSKLHVSRPSQMRMAGSKYKSNVPMNHGLISYQVPRNCFRISLPLCQKKELRLPHGYLFPAWRADFPPKKELSSSKVYPTRCCWAWDPTSSHHLSRPVAAPMSAKKCSG